MNKKGLLPGQVLIFILAGIIVVLILGFGYRAISDLVQSSADINIAELKADLESAIGATKRSYGSVRKIELRVPNEVQELCFFDPTKCQALVNAESAEGKSLVWAVQACRVQSANVFSIPRLVDLWIPEVHVQKSFVCIPNQGGLVTIQLMGLGNSVEIDIANAPNN